MKEEWKSDLDFILKTEIPLKYKGKVEEVRNLVKRVLVIGQMKEIDERMAEDRKNRVELALKDKLIGETTINNSN